MAANSIGPRPETLKKNKKSVPVKAEYSSSDVPADMTAVETSSWVDGDSNRARAALEAEYNRDNPRSTVIDSLERLASDETGIGVVTGEA
jgi:hypothetical protein